MKNVFGYKAGTYQAFTSSILLHIRIVVRMSHNQKPTLDEQVNAKTSPMKVNQKHRSFQVEILETFVINKHVFT